jgi:hypothetical protein
VEIGNGKFESGNWKLEKKAGLKFREKVFLPIE